MYIIEVQLRTYGRLDMSKHISIIEDVEARKHDTIRAAGQRKRPIEHER